MRRDRESAQSAVDPIWRPSLSSPKPASTTGVLCALCPRLPTSLCFLPLPSVDGPAIPITHHSDRVQRLFESPIQGSRIHQRCATRGVARGSCWGAPCGAVGVDADTYREAVWNSRRRLLVALHSSFSEEETNAPSRGTHDASRLENQPEALRTLRHRSPSRSPLGLLRQLRRARVVADLREHPPEKVAQGHDADA